MREGIPVVSSVGNVGLEGRLGTLGMAVGGVVGVATALGEVGTISANETQWPPRASQEVDREDSERRGSSYCTSITISRVLCDPFPFVV